MRGLDQHITEGDRVTCDVCGHEYNIGTGCSYCEKNLASYLVTVTCTTTYRAEALCEEHAEDVVARGEGAGGIDDVSETKDIKAERVV